jgi:hypothetical protein
MKIIETNRKHPNYNSYQFAKQNMYEKTLKKHPTPFGV